MTKEFILFGVGDVCPNRENNDEIFDGVRGTLAGGDVNFCQLEPVLTERGAPAPQARLTCSSSPKAAGAIKRAGFDVISFATNHCMDWGRDGFQDTLDVLREEGFKLIGAGENLAIARQRQVVTLEESETGDVTKVAFLAYCSILPQNYWAQDHKPGCAPMRAYTVYEQIEHDQPGTPCRIHTYPHREDMAHMLEDIAGAKAEADIVVVSAHWGIHFKEAEIAEYQIDYAHAAIDAGADIVLGHHAHILKPIEVYKGKVIFYSLGNFAMEEPDNMKRDIEALGEDMRQSKSHKEMQAINKSWTEGGNTRAFPADSYKSMIAKAVIRDKQIQQVSYLPVDIPIGNIPVVLDASDERFGGVIDYMKKIDAMEGMETIYTVKGNEVIINTGSEGINK